jgi:hypothetical protein
MNTHMKFSSNQLHYIEQGKQVRLSLQDAVTKACLSDINSPRPHHYLHSIAGYGKTHTIMEGVKNANVDYRLITGKTTLYAFGVQLAALQYEKIRRKQNNPTVIIVDDCDGLFTSVESLNIMKNVLEGERCFTRSVSMQSKMSEFTEMQQAAVRYFATDESLGFKVDCKNLIFVFASNQKLPSVKDLQGKRKIANGEHLHAIRSRCHYQSFEYNWERMWGWMADVTLNTTAAGNITQEQKMILLDWMFNNWDLLTEQSIRTVQKLAEIMNDNPETYKDKWELSFIQY